MIGKISPNSSSNNNVKPSKSQSVTGSSPGQVSNSPKMGVTSSSPKHNISSSPKNVSSGSSGKPSMSALKSVVTSPSSSGTKSNNELKSKSHKESSSREHKEKKSSNNGGGGSGGSSSSGTGHQSPKTKSSNGKFKQIDPSNANFMSPQYDAGLSGMIDPKLAFGLSQGKNKKGSLSAVIDKLKLQKCTDGPVEEGNNGGGSSGGSSSSGGNSKSGAPGVKEVKNNMTIIRSDDAKTVTVTKVPGEYIVKCSEGVRITLNKTKTKDSASKSGSMKSLTPSGSGSPKHGTLKPGSINSVTCKKPLSYKPPLSGSSSNKLSTSNISSKHSSKSGSGGSSSGSSGGGGGGGSSNSSGSSGGGSSSSSGSSSSKSKSNHSPKGSHSLDINRKEKVRISKIHSDNKSIFGGMPKRSSPSLLEGGDGEKTYKPQPPYQPPVVGNLIKPLDTKFQIPKLSVRNKVSAEGDVKKSEGSGSQSSEDSIKDMKTDSAAASSQMKLPFLNLDDTRVLLDTTKTTNSYDMKPKSTSENSLDTINAAAAASHPVTSNCSISAAVQSSDGVKLSL